MITETIQIGAGPRRAPGKHPAKMATDLALALVRDYSDPGDVVLDPFAGAGTTLWACRETGRRGVGVELEDVHADTSAANGATTRGDATRLPLRDASVDAVVTSPPYGDAIGRAGDRKPEKTARAKADYERARFGKVLSKHATYGSHPGNLGTLPLTRREGPSFEDAMPRAVAEIVRVLKPGGIACIVVRDARRGRRALGCYDLPGAVVRWGESAGARFVGRRFGVVPPARWTLWSRVNARRWGIPVPDVEHVVLLQRPAR